MFDMRKNIWLDYYRVFVSEPELPFLKALDEDSIEKILFLIALEWPVAFLYATFRLIDFLSTLYRLRLGKQVAPGVH